MLDWSDLRVFLEVHRAGSLSGAGRALGVYPSTVGRRIKTLEEEIGTVLFHRTPDGLVTTTAAEEMIEIVEAMERQAQVVTQGLSGRSRALEGKVRVALTGEFADHFVTDRIATLLRRFPKIEVDLITSNTRADLPGGEADLAVRFGMLGKGAPVRNQEADLLLARRVCEMGFALYASRAYLKKHGVPTRKAHLSKHAFILPSVGQSWMPGYEWILEQSEGARVALRSDSMSSMTFAAARGLGIALLPGFMAIQNKRLERLAVGGVLGVRDAWILFPKTMRSVARVRAVADFLEEVMREHEGQLSAKA
jgi:DNA-binding transcriptional LysR family regulator